MGGRPAQRGRAGGPGEVVEAQPEHDGAPDPAGRPHPAGDPVDQAGEHRVEFVGRPRSAGPARAATRSSCAAGRPGPGADPGCGPARADAGRPRARASRPAPPHRARRPGRRYGSRARQLLGGGRADAPQPAHRQRMEELQFALGRDDQQTVRLGHAAGHLGQELGPGHADRDRQADPVQYGPAQPGGDARWWPGDLAQAADVEERLVDGDASRPAGSCRGTPRTPPCWPRCRRRTAARRRPRPGRAAGPAGRPWRCARPGPWPRSWPPAPPPTRRPPAGRAAGGRRAARPRRRTRRGRRAGWCPRYPGSARTHVRTPMGGATRQRPRSGRPD